MDYEKYNWFRVEPKSELYSIITGFFASRKARMKEVELMEKRLGANELIQSGEKVVAFTFESLTPDLLTNWKKAPKKMQVAKHPAYVPVSRHPFYDEIKEIMKDGFIPGVRKLQDLIGYGGKLFIFNDCTVRYAFANVRGKTVYLGIPNTANKVKPKPGMKAIYLSEYLKAIGK